VVGLSPGAEHHCAETEWTYLDSGSSEAAILHTPDCTLELG
jgi:hypothetical protein